MSASGRPRVSVLIITLNEERLLDAVLESVRWADEIVVVDSGSTDRTEEIARRYTERFLVQPYEGEGTQRRRSLEASTGDWILYIDGDEIVSAELRASIEAALADPRGKSGFRIQLHTLFLGRWFGRRGWRKEWKVRLFRRDRGHFSPVRVHSGSVVEGPIGTLRGPLLHVPYRDLEHLVTKLNRYSTGMADSLVAGGRRGSALGAVLRGIARFLRDYLLGGDFLYGGAGLIRSLTAGHYTFLKYAKAWERTIPAPTAIAAAPAAPAAPAPTPARVQASASGSPE